MSNRVRTTNDGLARIRASIGATQFHGIRVQGHCMGIVARTWRLPSQAAGYGTAFDGAEAVRRAGRMRSGTAPVGSIVWWAHPSGNSRPGHVATVNRTGFCLGNVGATIQEAALSRFSNLRYMGWCWPQDVPNWGPVASGGSTPPPSNTIACGDVRLSHLVRNRQNSDSVRRLQKALNRLHRAGLPITGNYLDQTHAAVQRCQRNDRFTINGQPTNRVGPSQAAHLFQGCRCRVINDL